MVNSNKRNTSKDPRSFVCAIIAATHTRSIVIFLGRNSAKTRYDFAQFRAYNQWVMSDGVISHKFTFLGSCVCFFFFFCMTVMFLGRRKMGQSVQPKLYPKRASPASVDSEHWFTTLLA